MMLLTRPQKVTSLKKQKIGTIYLPTPEIRKSS